jgi:uncharacterized protein (DUF342 family)
MNATKHLVAAAAVIAIFGAGVLVGCWLQAPGSAGAAPIGSPAVSIEQRWSGATLEEYQRRLKLTPAQTEALRPSIQETSQKMAELRRNLKTELHAAVRRMNERVSTELTVEQRREFVALIREKQVAREDKDGK